MTKLLYPRLLHLLTGGGSRFWELRRHYSLASREEKWDLYRATFPPRLGERVLDVGASPREDLEGTNYFLHRYPHPEQLTAVAIEGVAELATSFPSVALVQADGRDLPFADGSFDVVHSNAVLEHVGPRDEQRRFVEELVRVARAGFVTTPSRWFPFEVHSAVPFAHWLPARTDEEPWLLSARQLRRLFPAGVDVRVVPQRILGWPATLSVIFRR